MHQLGQYWLFAVFCVVMVAIVLRLVLREHLTLRSSLSFLALLVAGIVFAASPKVAFAAAKIMGFELPSNFFFALAIGGLLLMHVHTLVMLSREELRTTMLTQEVALLREHLERVHPVEASRGVSTSTTRDSLKS